MRRTSTVIALLVVGSMVFVPKTAVALAACGGNSDFDGDGLGDIAVGVPGDDVGGDADAGSVSVFYGDAGQAGFHQDSSGMGDETEPNEQFGFALASGDFDGDGRDDLAVGVPRQSVGGDGGAGAVHIIYGSAAGLTASGDQVLHQDTSGTVDSAESSDEFGRSLVACDFDSDGRDDLVVGVPFENVTVDSDNEGAVHVIYGSATGLSSRDQVFHQDTSGMADQAGEQDVFGWTLAAGDFDNNGRDDVAVGVPQKDVNGQGNAGAVHIIYGSGTGLTASGDQVFHQDTSGIADSAEEFDRLGDSLATGDFDNDGRDDLAAGLPSQNVGGDAGAGAVHVLYGSGTGLTASGDQVFHQDTSGMTDDAEPFENFASSLAAGDFDNDGRVDLAVGIPGQEVGGDDAAGAVHVIYGAATGLSASGDQFLHQDSSGIAGFSAASEFFGDPLTTGDFDNDGRSDLVAGVKGQNLLPGNDDEGAVHLIFGSAAGLTASGDQVFRQDDPGANNYFGGSLVGSPFQIFDF